MHRRKLLKGLIAGTVVLTVGTYSVPARAMIAPAIVTIAGVLFSVAFRRYIIAPFMSLLARLFPLLFATELRQYLMAVAVALGLNEAKAATVAEIAENQGAVDIARDGFERITDIEITNNTTEPLELTHLHLLLVDIATRTVDLQSTTSWGLVVYPNATMQRQVASRRFPSPGLKQWYFSDKHRTLAISKPFMVVAYEPLTHQ